MVLAEGAQLRERDRDVYGGNHGDQYLRSAQRDRGRQQRGGVMGVGRAAGRRRMVMFLVLVVTAMAAGVPGVLLRSGGRERHVEGAGKMTRGRYEVSGRQRQRRQLLYTHETSRNFLALMG